ncbi:MAG TPA: hypothetical protein VGQ83_31360 [Polyangia bacterium]|jgi:hypothetical protein
MTELQSWMVFFGVILVRAGLMIAMLMAFSAPVYVIAKTAERLGWVRDPQPHPARA